MKRLFLALDLSEEARSALARRLHDLKRRVHGVKWVDPSLMHLTLKFLGNTPEDQVAQVIELAAPLAFATPRCRLTLRRLGAFPRPERPRVLWIGLEGDVGPIATLSAELHQQLVPLGFTPEDRSFAPHVTLARVRGGERIDPAGGIIEWFGDLPLASFDVSELVLYWSELLPAGPRYTALARLPFTEISR